jgi:hypothetical protein
MNSIRHVLSTTVCFRKVPRERSVGRTLWAIWDEDLECFKGGGFRKQLCKDMMGKTVARDTTRTKSKGRKRTDAAGDSTTDGRKAKRSKKDHSAPTASASLPTTFSYSIFPPTRPTPHHQPYYESCLPQQQHVPGDIIFPPLPPGLAYTRLGGTANAPTLASSSSVAGSQGECDADREDSPCSTASHTRVPSPPPSSASSVSVPDLTPNRSSSSSPPTTSELDGDNSTAVDNKTRKTAFAVFKVSNDVDEDLYVSADGEEDADDDTLLGPVKFWHESPMAAYNTLQPGIKLGFNSEDDDDEPLMSHSKAGKKPDKGKRKVCPPIRLMHCLGLT